MEALIGIGGGRRFSSNPGDMQTQLSTKIAKKTELNCNIVLVYVFGSFSLLIGLPFLSFFPVCIDGWMDGSSALWRHGDGANSEPY